jgi:hypothetical protein
MAAKPPGPVDPAQLQRHREAVAVIVAAPRSCHDAPRYLRDGFAVYQGDGILGGTPA